MCERKSRKDDAEKKSTFERLLNGRSKKSWFRFYTYWQLVGAMPIKLAILQSLPIAWRNQIKIESKLSPKIKLRITRLSPFSSKHKKRPNRKRVSGVLMPSLPFYLNLAADWIYSISQDIIIFVFKRKLKNTVFCCCVAVVCTSLAIYVWGICFFFLFWRNAVERKTRGKRKK